MDSKGDIFVSGATRLRQERREAIVREYGEIMAEHPGAQRVMVYRELAARHGVSEATVTRYIKQAESTRRDS